MAQGCTHILANRKECGRPIRENDLCLIHSISKHQGIQNANLQNLKIYMDEFPAEETIDLSGLRFDRAIMEKNFFPEREISFERSVFKDCSFNGCILIDADFNRATIDNSYFREVRFSGKKAIFSKANFRRDDNGLIFYHTIFEGLEELNFNRVDWGCRHRPLASASADAKTVSFIDAFIKCENFSISLIISQGQVINARYFAILSPSKVYFDRLNFEGNFTMEKWPHWQSNAITELSFEEIVFSGMRRVIFKFLDLRKARFNLSHVEAISFVNAEWPTGGDGRHILYDELEPKSTISDGELKRLYIQLKKNSEDSRTYDIASDWHFREMEARQRCIQHNNRIWTLLRRHALSFIPLYKYFSCYGESYVRPLLWLLAMMIFVPLLYLLAGFSESDNPIKYLIGNGLSLSQLGTFLNDYISAFSYSLNNLTFAKSEIFKTNSRLLEVLSALQRLYVTLFFSLFLLALRRRFKR